MAVPSIDSVREFLLEVNSGSADVERKIEEASNECRIEAGLFVFSLEGLWQLCDPRKSLPFVDFRRMLYASELNRQLREQGLEVAVYQSTGKVSSNLYCLKATCAEKSD